MNTFYMIMQMIIVLPFIVLLIYLSLRFGGSKLQQMQNGKYIKILERVALSKENSMIVAKIGDKGYVVSSTHGKVEILTELEEAELKALEERTALPKYDNLNELYKSFLVKRKVKND